MTIYWTSVARRLLTEESGEDIIEYGLLAALVGIAAMATWKALATSVRAAYLEADNDIQNLGAFTPNPVGPPPPPPPPPPQ